MLFCWFIWSFTYKFYGFMQHGKVSLPELRDAHFHDLNHYSFRTSMGNRLGTLNTVWAWIFIRKSNIWETEVWENEDWVYINEQWQRNIKIKKHIICCAHWSTKGGQKEKFKRVGQGNSKVVLVVFSYRINESEYYTGILKGQIFLAFFKCAFKATSKCKFR